MKLYIYDHCPYCVKAQMIFGFKRVPLELVNLLNDDEKSPIAMIGVKMVPILEIEKGNFMPESLDIVSYIDKQGGKSMVSWQEDQRLKAWLDKNSHICYELAMPRWGQAPLAEFRTKKARDYFQRKKEAYIGPFKTCLENTKALIEKMKKELEDLETLFGENQKFFSDSLSVNDFHLFAFLRSLSIVKGLTFPRRIKFYSEGISEKSQVPLHGSIAL